MPPRTSSSGIAAATSCRRSWPALRGARSGLRPRGGGWTLQREQEARPIAQPRPARVREAKRRLEEELATEIRANAAYEAYRATGRMKNGRRFGSPPKPYTPPEQPAGKINVTDPDSRTLKTPRGFLQGYNAQAVCNEQQIVVAAEVSVSSADFGQMGPMIDKARAAEPLSPPARFAAPYAWEEWSARARWARLPLPRSGSEPEHWSGLPPGAIRCLDRARRTRPNPGA